MLVLQHFRMRVRVQCIGCIIVPQVSHGFGCYDVLSSVRLPLPLQSWSWLWSGFGFERTEYNAAVQTKLASITEAAGERTENHACNNESCFLPWREIYACLCSGRLRGGLMHAAVAGLRRADTFLACTHSDPSYHPTELSNFQSTLRPARS